ncbi:MAG: DUF262 domain-containing protein [Peptostreptococcus porci]|nr:DUF262 domain-containing protein [Peptostreptococcus porci]
MNNLATTLHSFMDIFDTTFGENIDAVQLKKIIIPIIQRDYAQGRKGSDVTRVRERFLESLYKAVTEKPITLDFVYGDIDENGNMIPLDGQQRLTTLFLLHWYAAKKEKIPEEEYAFLKKFSYETRYSARYFCIDLVEYMPEFKTDISKEIINQAWFPLDWENDPTISSMLVMLDAIDNKFKDVENLWNKLKEKSITFYFLPIKDMGLTDELYIKMNSRGKPLTLFEHIKAELEHEIRSIDEKLANRIMGKIDRDWTDLLWEYRNSGSESSGDNIIDDEFLRYFNFICDVICYNQDKSPLGRSNDEFDLLQQYFSSKCSDAKKNIETMEEFFDCWRNISRYNSPTDFLNSFMANKHESGKILVENRYELNIFEDCLHSYSDKTGRIRQFPLNRIVLLYAITTYLRNADKVSEVDFKRRIRIVNNLIQNSKDEVSDRTDRNRMPAILAETEAIILTGDIDETIKNSFNVSQLMEEKEKIAFLVDHPDMADTLFELEDHFLLNGQISIVGLENLSYTKRFESLFKCSLDKVDCAMMAVGDYGQLERNERCYQYGSTKKSAWNELFHKSANSGFDNTKAVLISLLATNEEFSNEILKKIADDYLQECENKNLYPFRYYYIKYVEFRPGSFGKMHNNSAKTNPYMFLVMQTERKLSENSYYPYLKVASESNLSKDDKGQKLIFGDYHIICTNCSYLIRKNDDESIVDTIKISQNDEGIDTEDRIIVLKNYIKEKKLE